MNGNGRITKFAENRNNKIKNLQKEIDDLELKRVDEKIQLVLVKLN